MSMLRFTVRMITLILVCGYASGGWAQNYPTRAVRMMIAFSPGSGTDTIGRVMVAGMSEALGQQVVVENRAGATGNIGAEIVAKAPPDGYMLMLMNIAYAANATLFRNLPYDLQRDFAPVTRFATGPYVIISHPSLPVKTIGELVKLAKSKPGAVLYSSGGIGTATFLATEIFKTRAGIDMLHVPYKSGGEATTAVITGEVSIHFTNVATGLGHLKHGKLRALAVTSATRMPMVPDYPTVAESGFPGYEFGNWYGVVVPAKTPKEIIATVRNAVITGMKNPTVSKRFSEFGYLTVSDQPEEFAAYIKSEIEKLAKVIKAHNLTAN